MNVLKKAWLFPHVTIGGGIYHLAEEPWGAA